MHGGRSWWSSFLVDRKGTTAVVFTMLLPVIVLLIGGTLDYGQALVQRQRLQAAVDKAALAAARELGLSDARRDNVEAVVSAVVASAMAAGGEIVPLSSLVTSINQSPLEVAVTARQPTQPVFGGSFGLAPVDLEAHAVARIVGRPNICMLALDPSSSGAISLEVRARVSGEGCGIFSNSTSPTGIRSKASSVLSASDICSAGGMDGARGNFTPEPLTDCPTFDDPLADRPEPIPAPCDQTLPSSITTSASLRPGTYCGGLLIDYSADVALEPGIYIIKNGELRVRGGATLRGEGVGIYLVGTNAQIVFQRNSSIDLSAPTAGPMAGLLVFESRSQTTRGVHQILSDDARNLLGTIYLPRGRLHVDANNPVADKSAYTAIVARMITLYGGPHLVLNSRYELTNVPVPDGIRGANQPINLVR
jgi:hypothetical protein